MSVLFLLHGFYKELYNRSKRGGYVGGKPDKSNSNTVSDVY